MSLREFPQKMGAAVERFKLPKEVPAFMPAAEAPMSCGVLESHMLYLMSMSKNSSLELDRLDRIIAAMEKFDGAESLREARSDLEGGLSAGQQAELE